MKTTLNRLGKLLCVALLCGCTGYLTGGGDDGSDPSGPDDVDDDGRTIEFYYGPMKPMYAESVLYSIEAMTGHDFGSWDFTAPDPGSQAFIDAGNADGAWYPHCRLLGGCMDHRIPLGRTSFVGTAYVLQLEKAIAEACYDRAAFGHFPGGVAPDASTQPIDIINHQYRLAYASEPSREDIELSIAYFDSALEDPAGPELDDLTPLESAGRGHCRALLSTNRFLFY